MPKMRIQKALSDGGFLSRRKAEEYIAAGRITVNGHPAQIGQSVDPNRDVIAIDGQRAWFARKKQNIYLMLNKPRGYVTTMSDELGRRSVTELLEGMDARVYPVGRLDKDSEGLLLLTNDGDFANLIMHPSHHIGKTYRVTVRPDITDEQAARLSVGVDIGEGQRSLPATVLVLEKEPGRVVLQITINEGKNREIRRMCEAVGLEVARLKRVSIGPVSLGMLQPGKWRELKKSEVIALRNAAKPASEQEPIPEDDEPLKLGSFGKQPVHKPPRPEKPLTHRHKAADGTPRRENTYGKTADPRRGERPRTEKPGGKSAAYHYPDRPGAPRRGPKESGSRPYGKHGDAPRADYQPTGRSAGRPYPDKPGAPRRGPKKNG